MESSQCYRRDSNVKNSTKSFKQNPVYTESILLPEPKVYSAIFLGHTDAGKTTLLQRWAPLPGEVMPTVGIDYRNKDIQINGENIRIRLWDTAGQERYKSLTRDYYKRADAVIFVYDMTSLQSFIHASQCIQDFIQNERESNIPKMLIGNKSDLKKNCEQLVQSSLVDPLIFMHSLKYFETSAKFGDGVEVAFDYIVKALAKGSSKKANKANKSVKLSHKTLNKKIQKSTCC